MQRLGRYELVKPLGAGGMAQVWLARRRADDGVSKAVAVKILAPGLAADPKYQAMFRTEMRTSMWLSHSNIVQVFDCGVEAGQAYIVMEWVDGVNLAILLDAWREAKVEVPLDVVSLILSDLLRALAYAHDLQHEGTALGLVHRDISPQNVLLSVSGEVKLTDFGIARMTSEDTSSTQPKGKLRYMAPEQLRGRGVDRRTDLYAVGALLHELLSGDRFRHTATPEELFQLAWHGEMPELTRKVPPIFDALRRGLLAADPAGRPRDAAAALRSLVWQSRPGDPESWLAEWIRRLSGVGLPRSGIDAGLKTQTPVRSSLTAGDVTMTSLDPHSSMASINPALLHSAALGITPTRHHELANLGGESSTSPLPDGSAYPSEKLVPLTSMARTDDHEPSRSDEVEFARSRWRWAWVIGPGVIVVAVLTWMALGSANHSGVGPTFAESETTASTLTTRLQPGATSDVAVFAESTTPLDHSRAKASSTNEFSSEANAVESRVDEHSASSANRRIKASVEVVIKADGLGFAYVRIGRQSVLAEPRASLSVPVGRHLVYWRQNQKDEWRRAGTLNVQRDEPLQVRFGNDGSLHATPAR